MSMNNRITYDEKELIQMLEAELDKLGSFRFDSKYRRLLGNEFIDHLSSWDSIIRNQKNNPLTVVVCGEFKRGKSSIINALLGEDVVTTNVTTETITTNKISYGTHDNVIVLEKGKRMHLSDDELKSSKLKNILSQISEGTAQLEITRPIEILKELTIIDTPGLGDSLHDFQENVSDALSQADAVIYVYSVSFPISVQEQFFVKTCIKPQKYTELFLIGNGADLLESKEELDSINRVTKERIADILPADEPILISALDERCRQLDKPRPNEELASVFEENFNTFKEKLLKLLDDKRECVIPDRIERLTQSMTQNLEGELNALSQGLNMSVSDAKLKADELNEKMEAFVGKQTEAFEKIDSISSELKGDSIGWFEKFLDNMENDIDTLSSCDAEDIKKYYSIYSTDVLQEAIDKCNDYYLVSLYDAIDDIADGLSSGLSTDSIRSIPGFSISLRNKTWTKGDNIAFVANYISNSMVYLASSYIAGTMRQG